MKPCSRFTARTSLTRPAAPATSERRTSLCASPMDRSVGYGSTAESLCVRRKARSPEEYGGVFENFGVQRFFLQSFFDRDRNDFGRAQSGHVSEVFSMDELDCLQSQACGEDAIVCCRRTA